MKRVAFGWGGVSGDFSARSTHTTYEYLKCKY